MKTVLLTSTLALLLAACSKSAADGYPLTTCVISGEKLCSMGDPVVVKHEGKEVRLCCDHCLPKFQSDPAKYAAMVK
jgi:YHS domain-containing protein